MSVDAATDPPAAPPADVPPPGAPPQDRRSTDPLVGLAALVVVLAGMRAAAPLIVPVLLALFLALLTVPLVDSLERRGVPRLLAVNLALLADLGGLGLFSYLVVIAVGDFAASAPLYLQNLTDELRRASQALIDRRLMPRDWLIGVGDAAAMPELLGSLLGGTLQRLAMFLSYGVLVLFTTVFLIFETLELPAKLQLALGRGFGLRPYLRATRELQRYLRIKTAVGIAKGILLGVWVALLEVDFPLLWGLAAFALHYIPNLGALIAAVPPSLVALVQDGPATALAVAAGYLVVDMLLGNVLEPAWMGRRFGMSTLVAFLSVVFWGWLWGPVGMLLSVPLTMVVKVGLEHTVRWRWIATLLGPPVAPAPTPAS